MADDIEVRAGHPTRQDAGGAILIFWQNCVRLGLVDFGRFGGEADDVVWQLSIDAGAHRALQIGYYVDRMALFLDLVSQDSPESLELDGSVSGYPGTHYRQPVITHSSVGRDADRIARLAEESSTDLLHEGSITFGGQTCKIEVFRLYSV